MFDWFSLYFVTPGLRAECTWIIGKERHQDGGLCFEFLKSIKKKKWKHEDFTPTLSRTLLPVLYCIFCMCMCWFVSFVCLFVVLYLLYVCVVCVCVVLHVLYCIVLYCIALYCIVLHCIVLHCIVSATLIIGHPVIQRHISTTIQAD